MPIAECCAASLAAASGNVHLENFSAAIIAVDYNAAPVLFASRSAISRARHWHSSVITRARGSGEIMRRRFRPRVFVLVTERVCCRCCWVFTFAVLVCVSGCGSDSADSNSIGDLCQKHTRTDWSNAYQLQSSRANTFRTYVCNCVSLLVLRALCARSQHNSCAHAQCSAITFRQSGDTDNGIVNGWESLHHCEIISRLCANAIQSTMRTKLLGKLVLTCRRHNVCHMRHTTIIIMLEQSCNGRRSKSLRRISWTTWRVSERKEIIALRKSVWSVFVCKSSCVYVCNHESDKLSTNQPAWIILVHASSTKMTWPCSGSARNFDMWPSNTITVYLYALLVMQMV